MPNFRQTRKDCERMRSEKNAAFPVDSIVSVESERFHGIGIVAFDETCPLEKLAVLIESLNVWWYPIEDCQPYAGRMPSWMRGYMRRLKRQRQRPAMSEASATTQTSSEKGSVLH